MRAIVGLAFLALPSGCGSTKKAAGTVVVCKGGEPRVKVPKGPGGVNVGSAVGTVGGSSTTRRTLELTRSPDGVVTVSCGR